MKQLSIIGLGKLGCSMLACFAHKGWEVVGVDTLKDSVDKVNRGESPIYEPRVNDYIKSAKQRIRATTDIRNAVLSTDISFVIVPTPSKKEGDFSSEYVENAVRGIAEALKEKNTRHLIVITSTVMPGETLRMGNIIEKISGKKMGSEFGICYNPDFIAIGHIVQDFLNPDMVLIGQSDPASGYQLTEIHNLLTDNNPEINCMSIYNAELAKISLNAYCTLKITFANIIGEICEGMPTGNAIDVLNTIGADSRVGKKYFKAGLPFGGPCFPRDNRAFSIAAEKYGCKHHFSDLTDQINEYQKDRITEVVESYLESKDIVSILGLAYKEDTILVEESAMIPIVRNLALIGKKVKVYDPAGMPEAHKELKNSGIIWCENITDCVKDTKVCVVGTPWKDFKELDKEFFLMNMEESPLIIDIWNLYSFNRRDGVNCIKIGKNYSE